MSNRLIGMSIAYEEEIISYTHKAFIGKDFYSAGSFKYKRIKNRLGHRSKQLS